MTAQAAAHAAYDAARADGRRAEYAYRSRMDGRRAGGA